MSFASVFSNAGALVIALGAVLAVGVIGVTTVRAADDKKPAAVPALTVTTARATQSGWPVKLAANGNIAPWQGGDRRGRTGRAAHQRSSGERWRYRQTRPVLATFAPRRLRRPRTAECGRCRGRSGVG